MLSSGARELERHNLDLVGVQEVRWEKGGREQAGNYNIYMEKRMMVMII
jgi:hypothetical protein